MRKGVLTLGAVLLGGCPDDSDPMDTGADTTSATGVTAAMTATDSGSSSLTAGTSTGATTSMTSTGADMCPEPCPTGRCDDEGRCERVVFVTSDAYAADFGVAAAADQICATEAQDEGLPGVFQAFLTTNNAVTSAFENAALVLNDPSIFVLADPTRIVVVDAVERLRLDMNPDAELDHAIDLDAAGQPVDGTAATACDTSPDSGFRVWTGLGSGAGGLAAAGDCSGWSGAMNGGTGVLNQTGITWAAAGDCACDDAAGVGALPVAHLYCFEITGL